MRKLIYLIIFFTFILCTNMYAANSTIISKGIDVSSYQGIIDWNSVKEYGITFAFIRCKSAITGEDAMFDTNMVSVNAVGIPAGIYYYSGAMSDDEIIAETNYIIDKARNYDIELPLVLDIEGSMSCASQERLQRNISIFVNLVNKAGYKAMIYSSSNFFKEYIGDIDCSKWIACYKDTCIGYDSNTKYWQYTSKGSVPGIKGRVDMNYSYGKQISLNRGCV